MYSMMIKLTAVLLILILWSLLTYWAVRSSYHVWKIKEVDSKITIHLLKRAMLGWIPNPFSKVAEKIREKAELKVTIFLWQGYSFIPQGGETIASDHFKDRKQYSLIFENNTKEDFRDLRFVAQFPYPIEEHQLHNVINASGIRLVPLGTGMTFHASGPGARLQVFRKPLSRAYEFVVDELRQKGRIEIFILLNSWRDPRGKTIPKEEAARYLIPEWGLTLTYIHGHFKIKVGDETIEREYYAPIMLLEDKTISLGTSISPPQGLIREVGFE